ncbi:MAG: ATP-binding protein [Vicinamibacterales bacterium]
MTRLPLLAAATVVLSVLAPAAPGAQTPAAPAGATSAPRTGHPEEGRPFVRIYLPEDVGGAGQNWGLVQDARGVIYVASSSGVIEYDGVSWRLIEMAGLGIVRSIALDAGGRMYVGGAGELGYLETDATGALAYRSLLDRIPEEARGFRDVWRTFVTPSGVIFDAESYLFRWADDRMQVVRAPTRVSRGSIVDGVFHTTLPESGLNVLEGDRFRALPGTETLAREVYPVILRYDDTRLLIGTRANGFFLYDGATLTRFATEMDAVFSGGTVYRGIELPDRHFAIATTGAGLVILDRQGRRVAHVNRDNGLRSNAVYYVMVDREGAIWTAGEPGLARIETPSPASYFDASDGFPGYFNHMRYDGRLYFAAQSGVWYLRPATADDTPRFVRLPGIVNQCWWFDVMTAPESGPSPALTVACSDGLYEVQGLTTRPIRAPADGTYRASAVLRSRLDPTRLWVALFDGLASFRRVDGRWIDEGRVDGVTDQIRMIAEREDGSLWAGTNARGLLHVAFAGRPEPGRPRPPLATAERFGAKDGLHDDGVAIAPFGDTVYFTRWSAGRTNFFATWDEASRRFVNDEALAAQPFDILNSGYLAPLPDGRRGLFSTGRSMTVASRTADGSWTFDASPLGAYGRESPGFPAVDPDGVVWFRERGRLIRLDLARGAAAPQVPFTPLVRRVAGPAERLLFAGAGSAAPAELAAGEGTLRFEFAAPTFLDEAATEYQTRLDGLDDDWTGWTRETRRDVTNLGFGDYRFRVRARNVAGVTSDEAVYTFTVLPPWYRTWWAYLGYLLLGGALVLAIDRVQRRRVVAKERERARFAEAKLRAEAAEAVAASEREGKKNIELLGDIGREITASLDFETIFDKLYERVNQLVDADVFGVGLYHPERHEIEYRLAIEDGKRYAPYTRDTTDPDQLPVWCVEHRQPIVINDIATEATTYVKKYEEKRQRLEDGSLSKAPQSLIYLPLEAKDRVLGLITIQSFARHAYTDHDLNVLQSLASYTAIALDNAAAYRQLNEHEAEIRRLFEEAQKARAAAEEADAAKSAFLSTVSHELRTPLTSVLGFAKIIKKRLDERIFPLVPTDDRKVAQTIAQVDENLKVVVSEGERLTKLIDDVLDLAKIEAGKLEWHMEAVTVADILDRATAATASLLEHKGLTLVKEVAPGLPAVTGDRDRLIQVVINLISNAVKFTDVGSVTCRADRRGGDLVVSVIDTGLGIAPDDQPKVFERFKQVGDTLTDKPKGTGLGLPICREIVEHHGGRIWVDSTPGTGSTFSFTLPIGVSPLATPGTTPVELASLIRQLRDRVIVTAPRTSDRKARILVVDDEANIRELLTQEFTEAGYQVTTAANGRDAIAEVRRDRPDLVVLDVMMPEMNGFDAAAVLKNDPLTADIPIVILSIVQDRDRGFRVGVDRYLTKPIDTDLLFREVGALLEQRKSHKRVLVVDEDTSTVKTLTDVLTARGYTVSEARGEDLVEKARAMQPDIIMLSSVASARSDAVQMLRFEKGMDNVLFLVYQ